jgi:hypothetical protein
MVTRYAMATHSATAMIRYARVTRCAMAIRYGMADQVAMARCARVDRYAAVDHCAAADRCVAVDHCAAADRCVAVDRCVAADHCAAAAHSAVLDHFASAPCVRAVAAAHVAQAFPRLPVDRLAQVERAFARAAQVHSLPVAREHLALDISPQSARVATRRLGRDWHRGPHRYLPRPAAALGELAA